MKTVYACFTTDVIHEGHLNVIRTAQKYGRVMIGVMSDEAMVKFDRFPTLLCEERQELFRKLPEVDEVVVQNSVSYEENLLKYRPDYVIHGDNWQTNAQKVIRDEVVDILAEWGGQLIEVPYTRNEEVKRIDTKMREQLAMPEFRRKRLKQLLHLRPIVKAL